MRGRDARGRTAPAYFHDRRRHDSDLHRSDRRFRRRCDADPAVPDAEACGVVPFDVLSRPCCGRHQDQGRGDCQEPEAHSATDQERRDVRHHARLARTLTPAGDTCNCIAARGCRELHQLAWKLPAMAATVCATPVQLPVVATGPGTGKCSKTSATVLVMCRSCLELCCGIRLVSVPCHRMAPVVGF